MILNVCLKLNVCYSCFKLHIARLSMGIIVLIINCRFLPDNLLQHEKLYEVEENPGDVGHHVEQGNGYQHHRQVHLGFEPLFSEEKKEN